MKLSFTTLACPDWDLETILDRAVAYGYEAIDFRLLGGSVDLHTMPEFTNTLSDTVQTIQRAGLAVSGISSSIRIAQEDPDQRTADLNEVLPVLVNAATAMDCTTIRVFGGALNGRDRKRVTEEAAAHFAALAARAEGVDLLLETHDDWSRSSDVRPVMERVDAPNAGVLWDLHHPWRLGEEMSTTWSQLGEWVRYVHLKDARTRAAHPVELCLVGEGVVPVTKGLELLRGGGYDGYLVLEWEKKWHPEIEEPEVALPAYVEYMRGLGV